MDPPGTDSHTSKPTKRIRWATHRAPGTKGDRKRQSVLDRFHRRAGSGEKATADGDKPELATSEVDDGKSETGDSADNVGRKIFFNIPLSPDARDEEGHPRMHFPRNKIRTAKYTPISFVPKNLWFQFHNVANIYFLFIVILSVSRPRLRRLNLSNI